MVTKVAMALICNDKAIFYYSMSGNTKALVELADTSGFDVFNLSQIDPGELSFGQYKVILIGTSTIGRGVPHEYFKSIYKQLTSLKDRTIGLFGSGNSIYDVYCGALDIIEDVLIDKNKIIFKYKFESYPTNNTVLEFNSLIKEKVWCLSE